LVESSKPCQNGIHLQVYRLYYYYYNFLLHCKCNWFYKHFGFFSNTKNKYIIIFMVPSTEFSWYADSAQWFLWVPRLHISSINIMCDVSIVYCLFTIWSIILLLVFKIYYIAFNRIATAGRVLYFYMSFLQYNTYLHTIHLYICINDIYLLQGRIYAWAT